MKALIVIPAFNEGIKLTKVAERVHSFLVQQTSNVQYDAVLVDDASTDEQPAKLAQQYQFLLIRNENRSGVGFSLKRAYDYAIEKNYDAVVTMAGNNKDNPEEISRLLAPIVDGQADFVQGSRYLKSGTYGDMPLYRLLTTRFVHPILFSFVSGQRITDSTNGFRAFRADFLKEARMDFHQAWLDRYELEVYLFYYAIRLKYRVQEVGVSKIYPAKELGYSKMVPIVSWWSILKPMFLLFFRIRK
ncbi:MAG: hypothetical protein COV74_03020 [Candidatus Omnitrophica bacterium CG11_big_fil_rev_8_21_14_0_20_45_26]|uniref:Glycosyltransferase 2-like domain-containing protein n=1 Tax=Candidatus Abzuiibacterium crystallinum TaxID=1974748 RepID=A0A2H0LQV6_9BACT|nr:MAG: hypothetical protein COV74_03020 [Candidatus Omnitrophica bacterium CG11_big_fil_rev_8_21_14_0_20_45_26]PIW64649.1 MAG: hypothetical protein COW12_05045 [Candidatus Omnitrophica bacterium CG12_big_fil_rev_8_21_14_0_65_45_16]